jgi:hypothetical protein
MAITLGPQTEKILDTVLKALNSDTVRIPQPPRQALISATLYADSGNSQPIPTNVYVNNGYLWPKSGYLRFTENDELVHYSKIMTDKGFHAPMWHGVGPAPTAILVCDTVLANDHGQDTYCYLVSDDRGQKIRTWDSGALGVHDLAALFKTMKDDLTPLGLTVRAVSPDAVTILCNTAIANSLIGDTLTITANMTQPSNVGQTRTIIANGTDTITVDSAFPDTPEANTIYQLNVENYDEYLTQLYKSLPAHNILPNSAPDVGRNPGELSTTFVEMLFHIINQYVGTPPTTDSALSMLARDVKRSTYLVKPCLATEDVIFVKDASVLPFLGDILIGSTSATISLNRAKKGGQGPNEIKLDAVLGADEDAGAVVTVWGNGSISEGTRDHLPPKPHGWGAGLLEWLNATILAVEAHTLPT